MTEINEKRSNRRVLAVCRALDENGIFLGFTFDLTSEGIHIIVKKEFSNQSDFTLILTQHRQEKLSYPNIKVKVRTMWRKETNEEYDQIGGQIIEVDSQEALDNLVAYCDKKAKEKYQFDLELIED